MLCNAPFTYTHSSTQREKKNIFFLFLVDGLTLGIIENRCFQKQTVLLVDLCHMTKNLAIPDSSREKEEKTNVESSLKQKL